MVLPIVLGFPRAAIRVIRGQMRSPVLGFILLAPVAWAGVLIVAGWLWPVAVDYMARNTSFSLGSCLGFIAILLTPLSTRGRADFAEDFESSYGRFYTSAPQVLWSDQTNIGKEDLASEAQKILEPLRERLKLSASSSEGALLEICHIFDAAVVSLLEDLARSLIVAGISDVNILVDELHSLVSPYFEVGLTRRDVRDAFSGYRGLDPSDPEVQRYLAEIERLRNEADGLIKEQEAVSYEKNRDWQQAEKAYCEALRLNPGSKEVLEALGRIRATLKAIEEERNDAV
jgi:tetratricopeptide (TPR) repeat protein